MMAAILNSVSILNSAILDSAILHETLQLVHSDSIWWWQPSWIVPCWIQTLPSWIQKLCYLLSDLLKNTLSPLWLWLKLIQFDSKLIHSHLTWWWQPYCILPSWILPSWIQPFSSNFWLQLIQSDPKSFILINLMMAAILNSSILNSVILDSAIFVFPFKLTHTCQDWFPPLAQKTFTHSFWLNLMMAAILNSAGVGFRHNVFFSEIHSKTLSLSPV